MTIGLGGNVGGGGGATIGDAVTGGTANRVLYIDASGNLADSANLTFNGTTLTAAGTITSTSGLFNSPTYNEINASSGTAVLFSVAGTRLGVVDTLGMHVGSGDFFGFTSGADPVGSINDTALGRNAAGVVEVNSGTAGAYRDLLARTLYSGTAATGVTYSRLAIKHATTSVTAAVGATVTATSLIPAKANVMGVNTVVTTGLGTGTGTTGYTVGDGTDADRWGSVTGTAAGTDTDGNDATANPTGWFTAANNVVITALGGNFDGTGVIYIDVAYTISEAD